MRAFVLIALCALVLCGCPGSLENPDRFMMTQPLCAGGVDPERDIFVPKCGDQVCHGNGAQSAGALDLVTPGIAMRLLDVPAIGCSNRVLVSTSTVDDSVLLDRINAGPQCGPRMPLARMALSEAEITCVRIYSFAIVRTATSGDTQ